MSPEAPSGPPRGETGAGQAVVVSGTGTGVGKTVVTAALAALAAAAGRRVAVAKPAQTGVGPGEPGDLEEVRRLSGVTDLHELHRYPDPLAPATAARRAGQPAVDLPAAAARLAGLAAGRDLLLVEGAGGLLVRYDESGGTLADLAGLLGAPVLLVARAGLGTLNETALTLEALDRRGLALAGLVIGAWPAEPDLADRCNLADLADLAGRPLDGVLPAGAGRLEPGAFAGLAAAALGPRWGGRFDPAAFTAAFG